MKKSLPYILLFMFLLIGFPGCKKCTQNELANLKFTTDDLSINPYSGNEGLVFRNLTGDSIVFLQGKRAAYSSTYHQYPDADYNHSCPGDYYSKETDQTDFYTTSGTSSPYLGIELDFNISFENPDYEKTIFLEFFSPSTDISGFYGLFLFNNDSIFNYPKKYDTIVQKHSQLTIGPRTFANVYELYAMNREKIHPEWFSIAYYSTKEGFCGFKSTNGILWYLDRKLK